MVPQKHVACPPVRAFPQAPATAAVKNLWGSYIFMHLSLVKRDALSDKSDMAWGSDIFHIMLNWVLPERCPCCGAITPAGGPFCVSCWQNLEFLGPPWCRGCAAPFEFDRGDDAYCALCIAHPPRHDGIRAAVKYDDVSAQVVLRLKYGGKIGLARVIARQLVRHLPDDHANLIITPVPLHWTRMWSRTFNQSALIGQELAALSGIPFVPDILVRHKRTPTMRGLDVRRRKKAVGGAFAVNPKWQGRVKGLRLILIDDVFTTGATSDGCVSVLKRNGASWVQIFCWARALRGTNHRPASISRDA
jgi:ComF family protein